MYKQDTLNALGVIAEAQRIAFAPILSQAALCLRNARILNYLDRQGKQGASLNAITEHTVLNEYAMSVLLNVGLNRRIIAYKRGIYYLAKIGYYLLHDTMTRVNMDFTQDVCYQGLFFLADSLNEGEPSGLKVLGDQSAIYPALSQLSDIARDGWLAFGHYYSDSTFSATLPYVFANNPTTLYDVGGNTGKWALCCCKSNKNTAVMLLDLPQRIMLAKENIANASFSDRIDFHVVGMLSDAPLPDEAGIWWMSQFSGCFLPEQVISILSKVASAIKPGAKLCIMELFWDTQRFEATSSSLNISSLYFTCMADGDNRFYSAEKFYDYLNKAGFQVAERHDNLGIGHTLLACQKKQSSLNNFGLPRTRADETYIKYYRLAGTGAQA